MKKSLIAVSVACGLIGSAEAGKKKFKPAKHYAALFVAGNSWTYTVTELKARFLELPNGDWMQVPESIVATTVTCKVTEAHAFRNGATSRISCDADLDDLAATWIATARGLWTLDWESEHAHVGIETLPKQSQLALVLAARPRVKDDLEQVEEGFLGTEITKDHGAWCVTDTSNGIGESGYSTACYDELGIRRGDYVHEVEDESFHEIIYTRQ